MVTRTLARQVFRELRIVGELYRGYTLISLNWKEWRITQFPYDSFDTRQEARDWINKYIREHYREMLMDKMRDL